MPPTITQPIWMRLSAPAPVARASGSAPSTMAPVVIRIGRRRCDAALTSASTSSRPCSRSWLVNSTIRMPCLVIRPTSVIRPICEYTLSEPPGPLERQQRADHRQRHRQHDHQRIDEALELRRQHQEDEQQRQHEHDGQRALRTAELARGAVQLGGVAGLEHLGRGLVHEGERLAQRVVRRQVGRDRDRAALAEVVELARAHALAHLDQGRQRDHGVAPAAHVDAVDVLRRGAAARPRSARSRRTARRRACSASRCGRPAWSPAPWPPLPRSRPCRPPWRGRPRCAARACSGAGRRRARRCPGSSRSRRASGAPRG